MSGGQFTSYNKVLPGIYINYKSKPKLNATTGDRGICAIAQQLGWGPMGEIIEIEDITQLLPKVGYDITDEQMLFIREMTRGTNLTAGASKIFLYRLEETGDKAKATVTIGTMKIDAKYEGTRGNELAVIVSPILESKHSEDETYFQWKLEVLLNGNKVEEFTRGTFTGSDEESVEPTVESFKDIESNWITVSGTGKLTNAIATSLTGGKNGTVSTMAHSNFQKLLGKLDFNVVIYDGNDTVTKGAYKSFVNRLCTQEGKYCVLVVSNYLADSEYVISVNNAFTNEEGISLTPEQATWWVGGASSGANYNESLTYHKIPGATAVHPEYEKSELEKLLKGGNFLFVKMDNEMLVLSDVNTFVSFTPTKNSDLRKNRIIRTIMQICNDLYLNISKQYIGKVDVNDEGLKLIQGYGINYLNLIQANNGIQNFVKEDFNIAQLEVDSVVIKMNIQPVDSLEKVYIEMTIG